MAQFLGEGWGGCCSGLSEGSAYLCGVPNTSTTSLTILSNSKKTFGTRVRTLATESLAGAHSELRHECDEGVHKFASESVL